MESIDSKVESPHIFVVSGAEICYMSENNKKYEDKFQNIPFLKSCGNFFFHNKSPIKFYHAQANDVKYAIEKGSQTAFSSTEIIF